MATLMGNIRPKVKKLKAKRLPRKSILENTKAARLQTTSTPAVAASMTTRLLRSMSQNDGVPKILV
jgi:hypothetical protein